MATETSGIIDDCRTTTRQRGQSVYCTYVPTKPTTHRAQERDNPVCWSSGRGTGRIMNAYPLRTSLSYHAPCPIQYDLPPPPPSRPCLRKKNNVRAHPCLFGALFFKPIILAFLLGYHIGFITKEWDLGPCIISSCYSPLRRVAASSSRGCAEHPSEALLFQILDVTPSYGRVCPCFPCAYSRALELPTTLPRHSNHQGPIL